MSKTALVTNAEVDLSRAIARHLIERGMRVVVHTEHAAAGQTLREFAAEQSASDRLTILETAPGEGLVEAALGVADRLDVAILCVPSVDERQMWVEEPAALREAVTVRLDQIFRMSRRLCNHMMQYKAGSIIFPLVYDPLAHADVATTAILDHAKIVFAKCLAKEMAPFKVAVNLMTFGLHDRGYDRTAKKAALDRMEIFNLKPRVRDLAEMVKAIDTLVFPSVPFMSGQNIGLEPGMEFNI